MGIQAEAAAIPDEHLTNKQAFDRAVDTLLRSVGIARTKTIMAEAIAGFRKRVPGNAVYAGNAERDLAFGPELLVRARLVERVCVAPECST
ncbi:hypothetical protein [Burkholderia vietnamiensis]|uniref:hypothetical protein n=1 Tax=Burkholderia vietnamiensis TaxID=60552 RepID=UPI001CF414D2|nr:hypothetical protein [Burkholderia vietnamiensis]MCA8229200.1 hypothetical protein [Burkholderia vietnamiensis]